MKVQKAKKLTNFDWMKEHMGVDGESIVYIPEGDGEYVKFCGPDYEDVVAYSPDVIIVSDETDKEQQALALWKRWFAWRSGDPWEAVDGFLICIFCGEDQPNHEPDCVYVVAKELVEDDSRSIDKLSNDCKFEIRARYGKCTTRVPVDQAPAGPALDAAVAVALGKQVKWMEAIIERPTWPAYLAGIMSSRDTGWKEEDDWRVVPGYSTDIAAAWELAINPPESSDHVAIYLLSVSQNITGDWRARFGEQPMAIGNTAPLAITRAYLKVKDVEWIEVPD